MSRAKEDCRYELLLDFSGYVTRFVCNSRHLHDQLGHYFRHFTANEGSLVHWPVEGLHTDTPEIIGGWQVKQPDPGKTKIKEHILEEPDLRVVKKVLTGVHLIFSGDRYLCVGPLEENPNQVVNFINNIYLDELLRESGQLFHAAGVCRGAVGVGMAGQSGKGKSTLAMRLLARGMDFVSNDRLVVDRQEDGLAMRGIAKYPRINPGTVINEPGLVGLASEADLARYNSLSPDALWTLEEKYDAFVEQSFGCEFQLQAKMELFVALDWERAAGSATRLEQRDPRDCQELVQTVMKTPGVMLPKANARIAVPAVHDYVELLTHCKFYVLTGGVDFDSAADQLLEQIDGRS